MEAAFDTLAYAERLKAAGIETSHANALTDALRIAFSEGVATKADVREVRADITRIEENMATKLDLALLDKRMDGLDKRIDNIDENMATKTESRAPRNAAPALDEPRRVRDIGHGHCPRRRHHRRHRPHVAPAPPLARPAAPA